MCVRYKHMSKSVDGDSRNLTKRSGDVVIGRRFGSRTRSQIWKVLEKRSFEDESDYG